MKFLYRTAAILLLASGCTALNGQDFPYTFDSKTEPYEDLVDATVLLTGVWDDPDMEVPIGFDFEYFGNTFDTIYQASVGAMLVFDLENYYYTPTDWLFAYGSDLIDRGAVNDQPASPISYKTEGNQGSRICKIEWKNAGFYEEFKMGGNTTNFVNFQLWLYEGSNDIEVRFGPNNITLNTQVHLFNGRPFVGMIENFDIGAYSYDLCWYLSGPPSGPKVGLSTNFFDLFTINSLDDNPTDGMVYQFLTGLSSDSEAKDLGANFRVFPTLVSSGVTVSLDDPAFQNATVSLTNQLGQPLQMRPLQHGRQTLDMQGLPPGTYVVTIRTDSQVFSKKIIKM